jgi:hypothetical protein
MKRIEERVKELPPDLKREVEKFVDSLERKRRKRPGAKVKMEWAGALKDLRQKYTSVELQHKISEWRIGEK